MDVAKVLGNRRGRMAPNGGTTPSLARRSGRDGHPRVALYSHDTMGLGHVRRNLLVAQALASPPINASILMIAGAREASAFETPPVVDFLTLPALFKEEDGRYRSRALDLTLRELTALRERTIRAAVEAFDPDVMIVDNVPRGANGELDVTLDYLRGRAGTRCVLGLRDVLDEPVVVKREWREAHNQEVIREHYGAVWVYGDPAVYDTVTEYGFSPEITSKVTYTGYLDASARLDDGPAEGSDASLLRLPEGRFVLCVVGGGQDGAHLAGAFAAVEFPPQTTGVIVTGPFMPAGVRRLLHGRAARDPHLRVLDFVSEPSWLMRRADRVVGMGGYNTVTEVLSFGKPALIVPRVMPRREQWIRAERLRELGLVDVLHPDNLTPQALGAWLFREAGGFLPTVRRIALNGLTRLPSLLDEMLRRRSG